VLLFEKSLIIDEDHIPSLKGLADTYMEIAVKKLNEGRFNGANEAIVKASTISYRLVGLCGNAVSAHKLAGDVHSLAKQLAGISFSESKDPEEGVRNQLSFIRRGSVSYIKAIHLDPSNAALRYDLAINQYFQAGVINLNNGSGSGIVEVNDLTEEAKHLLVVCERLLHDSIYMDPKNSLFWNALGIVATSPVKRQHCFIRSIQLDNNHSAWNNLGMMYLEYNKVDLAKEALLASQCLNPASGTMWLGIVIYIYIYIYIIHKCTCIIMYIMCIL
jgi:superkiller protein 3